MSRLRKDYSKILHIYAGGGNKKSIYKIYKKNLGGDEDLAKNGYASIDENHNRSVDYKGGKVKGREEGSSLPRIQSKGIILPDISPHPISSKQHDQPTLNSYRSKSNIHVGGGGSV